jgi:alkylation response protein AidB-like acyl-CoA dehydrogenase
MTMSDPSVPVMTLIPSEEEEAIRRSVRQIVSKYGPSYYLEHVRRKEPMRELIKELSDAGFLGIHIPEEFGGSGLGMHEMCIVIEECGRQGINVTFLVTTHSLSVPILQRHGTRAQQEDYIPRLARGETFFAIGITEPDAGSNTHNIKTTAVRKGDKWVINGQKVWTTGFKDSEKVLLLARTGTDEITGRGELTLFLFDTDLPGITSKAIPTGANYPEDSFQVFYDNVEVDDSCIVGGLGQGLKCLFHGLNPERFFVASVAIGLGHYMLDKATKYAKDRSVWGYPIARHQGVAHPLADAKAQLETAALMVRKASLLHDAGEDAGDASNLGKYMAANACNACVDAAMAVHGGNAVALEYELIQYTGQIRLMKIAPVSTQMILNHVAQNMLGLPKSY